MENNDKNLVERLYEQTIGKFLSHFDNHRIQGRIFFSGMLILIVGLVFTMHTYSAVMGIAHGFEIKEYLHELLKKCL